MNQVGFLSALRRGLFGVGTAAALVAGSAQADVSVTPRHLMILRPGLDAVYGSYVFAVENTASTPATLRTAVMLPKETVDFVPQEGVSPDEISLAPDGGMVVDKAFNEGVNIVSIGFKTDASYGKAGLTLTPRIDVESFTLLIPKGSGMLVSGDNFSAGGAGTVPDPQYESYVSRGPLKAGTTTTVTINGLPEGRRRVWILAGGVTGVLLLVAGFLAWRTRPKLSEDAGSMVVVS